MYIYNIYLHINFSCLHLENLCFTNINKCYIQRSSVDLQSTRHCQKKRHCQSPVTINKG